MNLHVGLRKAILRAREIEALYNGLPEGSGAPGAALVHGMIDRAEVCMKSGSVEDRIAAYKALVELE